MTHAPYLLAGYGLTAAVIGLYSGWLVWRRRALATPSAGPADDAPGGLAP